jgi:hypothetical protein
MGGVRSEWLGDRAELLPKRQRLEVECEALRDSLLRLLPTHTPVLALDGEKIVNTAIALNTSLGELAGIQRMIGVLEDKLGM